MLSRYFGGIVIQIFLVSMGLFIGLSILGVPNAALIALLAALFNVIPYVGPIIGGSLGIFLTITSSLDLDFYNQMLPLLGKVALVFAIMQMVDNFLLQPFIFSNRVYAHPLEIFVVVLVGAQVGGILGMVIAIPSYTVIRIIAKNFLSEFHIIQNITKGLQQDNDNNSPE
jgi:predicted PurR-regulated permease PerM